MSLIIVGSVALDTIETPAGNVADALGGSALYASLAATHFCPVSIVGVVGTDYPPSAIEMLKSHNINLDGLEQVEGKTFRWSGKYVSFNQAETLSTDLNVFADFDPKLPDSCTSCYTLFLANIHPKLQLKVLSEMKHYSLVACDTMNYWIQLCPDLLTELIRKVDILFINEDEIRQYTTERDIFLAARLILDMGVRLVVVKRGECGAVIISKESYYFAPAYPISPVRDTTGAGDSFAGGFLGYISAKKSLDDQTIRQALRYGTVMAALNVAEFSVDGLHTADQQRIESMQKKLKEWTS
ncbi:MAG TPA: PfkB family carbohydrate kinase [Candidatus Cloacimonadota bacterium]|nr:PfkB family carbohydrate kinase [Candidatus Cloacimonadota bacterium]